MRGSSPSVIRKGGVGRRVASQRAWRDEASGAVGGLCGLPLRGMGFAGAWDAIEWRIGGQAVTFCPRFLGGEAKMAFRSVDSVVPQRKRMVSPRKSMVSLSQRTVSPRKRMVSLPRRMVSPRKRMVPLPQRMVSLRKSVFPLSRRMVPPRKRIHPISSGIHAARQGVAAQRRLTRFRAFPVAALASARSPPDLPQSSG